MIIFVNIIFLIAFEGSREDDIKLFLGEKMRYAELKKLCNQIEIKLLEISSKKKVVETTRRPYFTKN